MGIQGKTDVVLTDDMCASRKPSPEGEVGPAARAA
jgi:hypothetical protein